MSIFNVGLYAHLLGYTRECNRTAIQVSL